MDQATLVEERKAGGQQLISRLLEEGIEVTAACWLRETEGGRWYLNIATPLVGKDRAPSDGYRRIIPLIQQIPPPHWLDPMDVKLIPPDSPIAEAVRDLHRKYPGRGPIHLGETIFARRSIEGAYVYPPASAPAR
jgi:hypothetical protein